MASSTDAVAVFWFRRDLRLHDNAGLYHALRSGYKVLPVFIFDSDILDKLDNKEDRRLTFIHQEVERLNRELGQEWKSGLKVYHGKPIGVYRQLLKDFAIKTVFCNRDYEPYARQRDKEIYEFLNSEGVSLKGYKDQVIFDKYEVVKDDGKPYTVYTPYMRKWKSRLHDFYLRSYPTLKYAENFLQLDEQQLPPLEEMGFTTVEFDFPTRDIDQEVINTYHKTRDVPAIKGTSRMSLHLRFGTVSIRELARVGQQENEKYFNELIWRDFYQMILYHFPHTVENSFRPAYDHIRWENKEEYFHKWKEGKTGYPLVDAGMRELSTTGFMHNRIRMVVASFLTKHLLIDWRWGEAWFAEKLLDYEQASNVGGWQWAAGSGVDAAPYFRVFNPALQLQKFDPDYKYVKQYVPEYGTAHYPEPIVDHKEARERAIQRFKEALS
ncbi:MAG TPA: deoxyribodipyrimidine photolyase [Cryomorphaceae bacterium]|nr:deoxyribodipyrimidine photolyase [Cryomorphaceae bacterium]